MMGFNEQLMPIPAQFTCRECNNEIAMDTFEYKCPHCGTIYAVTPCHAFDVENIMCAGERGRIKIGRELSSIFILEH